MKKHPEPDLGEGEALDLSQHDFFFLGIILGLGWVHRNQTKSNTSNFVFE